jgi:hypothetical protein
MSKFQLHLIARIDDTAHVLAKEVKVHNHFDFALTVRLRWTKNCLEERDAPEQIVLGSSDPDFCVLIALAIYIQYSLEFTNAAHSNYLFCDTEETPDNVKKQMQDTLRRRVLQSDEWKVAEERLGADRNIG